MNKRIISMLLVLVMLFSSIGISEENVSVPGAEPKGEEIVIVNENETETVTEAEAETSEADDREGGNDETAASEADEIENVIAENETDENGEDASDEAAPGEETEEKTVQEEISAESEEEQVTEPVAEEPVDAESAKEEIIETEEETETEPSGEEDEESTEEEQTEPEAEEELDEEADPSCRGDVSFVSGWVKLLYGTNLYENQTTHEVFAYTAKAGVAYAIGRVNAGADGDRMQVVYAGGNGIATVFIKSNAVYPMSADEIALYTEELEKTEETVYSYVGESSVTLLAIPVTYWNAEEIEETETIENEESEITEEPENDEPIEGDEPEIEEPTENDEPEIIEPIEGDEPEIIEPTENDEPEIIEPVVEDEPEIIEPAVEEDPVFAMMLTLLSAPGPVYSPTAVKFDYPLLTMSVKDSVPLAYTVTGAPASCVGFVVSDESVASVSADGNVTAKTAGVVVVTMVAPNGLTDSLAISVLAAPTDIKVNVDEVTVDENGTALVTTSFTGDVYGEVYLKDNSDNTIAEAEYIGNGSFEIRGLLSGETTLTFAVDNKDNGNTYTASVYVTVNPAIVRIEVTNPRETVGYNEKVYLMPVAYDGRGNVMETAFTYATSNKSKVAVAGEQIQAKTTSGSAVITITADNGVKTTFTVKCVKAPGSVTLPAKTAKLAVGESVKLTATLPSGSDSAITWASSNEEIVTVSEDGIVTAVSAGKAQVRAAAFNGKYALCEFIVVAAPTEIIFSEASYSMKEGETFPAVILFTPDNAGGQVAYSVENTDVATISADGVITAVTAGNTCLHAVVHNFVNGEDYEAYADLTVKPNVYEIRLGTDRRTLGAGETLSLAPVAYDRNGNVVDTTFTYKASSTYYTKLIAPDAIKGNYAGSSTITITAANGVSIAAAFKVMKAPTAIKLNTESAKLVTGETMELAYALNSGADSAITWDAQPAGIVTVDESGHVEAVGAGEAIISCTTFNGKKATCSVNVTESPAEFAFKYEEYEVAEGDIIMPEMVMDIPVTNAPIVFSISYTDELPIASVSGNSVKGGYSGYATLTATVHNVKENRDLSAETTIKVVPGVCSIEFRPDRSKIGYKETLDPMPQAYDARGNKIAASFSYKSSSTSIKVVEGGLYGNSGSGSANITVTAENGVSAVKKFTLGAAPTTVKLDKTSATLVMTQSVQLTAATNFTEELDITWTSSDKSVVEVEDGLVTAIGPGNATITASAYNGKSAACKVTVGSIIEDIAFGQSAYTVKEGAVITPDITLVPDTAFGTITLSVEDSDEEYEIAAVSGNSVRGLISGTATVTATVHEIITDTDISRTFTVNVEPAPRTVEAAEEIVIGYNEIADVIAVAYDGRGNAVDTTFTLKPASTYVLKVNGNQIKGGSTGSTKLTISAGNGVNTVVPVKVVSAPSSITLNASILNVQLGESAELIAALPKNTHGSITYTSSDEDVAVVDANGIVTGIGIGEATITAATHNGKKATCKVTVGSAPTELAVEDVTVKEGASVVPAIVLLPEGSMGKVTLTAASGDDNEFVAIEGNAVKGLAAGSTTVTATVYDVARGVDVSKTFNVTVESAVCTIAVEKSVILGCNEIVDLAPVAYDGRGNAIETSFTLKPSSTYYVKVNGTQIKGSASGKATVTVTAENGVSAVVSVQVVSAPGSVTLNAVNVQPGETVELVPKLPKNTHASFNYASADETVAIVDDNGFVTGISMGEAAITVTTHNGKKATCKVTVGSAPEELIVEDVTVKEGASVVPDIVLLPEGSMGKVTLTAEGGDDNAFVAIDGDTITGLTAGSTTVTASVYDVARSVNVSKTFNVTVDPAPCTIAVEESVVLGYNEILDLAPVALDANGNAVETPFTLKPSSTYYVKVNGTQIKGTATGKAKVTVTAENGVSAVVSVQIISAPGSITLNAAALNLQLGESTELVPTLPKNTHASITYTSSAESVAVVDENGLVTGMGMGEATITAATHNGKKATCKVKVGSAPEKLYIEEVRVKECASVVPEIVLLPEGSMGKITLTAEDNEFIAIDGNVIRGLVPGVATVTASVYDVMGDKEVVKTFNVIVEPAPYTIKVADDIVIGYGEIIDVAPIAYDVNGNVVDTTFTLKTSSTYRLKVNGTQIKGGSTGSVNLTVTAENGVNIVVPVKVCAAPGSVTLNTKAMTLQNGTSSVLTAALPKNTAGAVTFTSSDETVAIVSADGTVIAVGEGSAVITAATFNGKKATCTVNVMGKAESIAFDRETIYIAPGSTAALKVSTLPAGSYTALTYESSDPAIVSVDAEGNIKAIAGGEVTITARGFSSESMSEITAKAVVKVNGKIAYIDPGCEDTLTMGVGEILYLDPVAYDSEGNIIESDYTYTTSNRYRVSVSGNMLKAAGAGTGCTVTVKASNGVSAVIGITVVSAPAKVAIPATMKLSVNETGVIPVTLPAKTHATFAFASSDPAVISVKDDGSFLATGTGSAKVSVKTHNGKTDTCTVTVMGAPESIAFADAQITVKEGASVPAVVTFMPEGSWSKLSYTLSGSEEELVSVDDNGILTGKLSGNAVLHASAVNYLTNETISCSVPISVLPAPRTIEFRGERIGNAGIGEEIDLKPVALDARGNEIETVFTLKSASGNARVVSGTTVKLNSSGTAKITATAENGVSAVVSFKISYAPTTIKMDASSYVVPVNGSVKLSSTANNTPACGRTWESSNEEVATVTDEGLVQALSIGTATITVRTYNGKTAKCAVTVLPEAEEITFNNKEVIVGEGGTLIQSAVLPEGTAARIVYASRNPFVATVNPATGLVTGVKAGVTTVTATIKNVTTGMHYTATYTIVVKPAPATIVLLEERRTIGAGETLELKAVAYDASGELTSGGFTYKTSAKNYLSLPQDGFIKGGYTGTAKIAVTAYNGVSEIFTFKIVAAPTAIKLNTKAVTMSEADSYQLSYKLNSTTTTGAVTFASDNEDVVTVDENGLVTAHGAGTATVTVRTYNGKTNSCKFTVLFEPDGIALDRNMLTLGETATYALSCSFSEGHTGNVTYQSSKPEFASVDENGVITANLQGEATITATTVNRITGVSYSDTCLVTVTAQPVKIVILNERDAIGYGETMTLDIASYDASGNQLDGKFTVSSSNSNYIKVSGNNIRGMRTGSAAIKIVAYNGCTYIKTIKVTSAPSSVKLNAASAKVVIGAIGFDAVATLNSTTVASAISWLVEDPEIAAVDENGHISGVSAGTTRVKATTYNGKYALMTVEVYNQPESVSFESEVLALGVGDSVTPAYFFNENAYSTVTFSCPETDIATVNENGTITAKKTGTAHVTVTTVNGKTDTVTVNVVAAPDSVDFSEATVTLGIGQKLDVADLVILPEGTASSLKFAVESSSILTLNGSIITGRNKGTTRVKVTTYNGKTALLTVSVKYAPSSIKVALVNKVLYEGDTPEFNITLTSGSAASYTFESSDPTVLSFDENGVGHANSMGTAKVKVTTHNNVTATISVNVYKHVSGVSFTDEAVTLVHYDAQPLRYIVTPEIAYDTTVSFTSSAPEYVSVIGGIIEARQVTSEPVIITVTTNDLGFTDTLAVTVTPVRVTGIELSAEEITLERNREATIGATILPSNADDKLIEWISSDNSVATVDFNGKVTAVGDSGTATITATTHDGSFVKTVTVTATKVHMKGAAAQYATYEIEHYATEQLGNIITPVDADIASVIWTSSDESVLTVDENGRIYGADEGKANVTCVITDTFGASFTCVTAVTVTPVHVKSVELSEHEMTLRVGRGKQVDLDVYPFNADDKTVTWSADTQNRVTITENEDGAFVIAGQTAGDVTLTVTSNDGAKTDNCLIHVLDTLEVVPSSEMPKTTTGNDIVFYIDVMNAIGNVTWNISVKKDDAVIKTYTSYDAEKGIPVENAQNGIYTIEVTVTDSENDTANGSYSVEVSERIEYEKDGFIYSYIIAETSSGDIGAFIKLESCPAGTASITVPSSMNEAPVVRIDTEAFMGLTTLKNVAIPASCTEIGARAFKGCTSLTGITNY